MHEGIERLMAGRTVVLVAHRLRTVQRADRIVFRFTNGNTHPLWVTSASLPKRNKQTRHMSRITQRFTRLTAATAAGLIGLAVAALPAQAQQSPDNPQYAPTMLILDASGSMQRPDPAGTMMDAAKNAVRNFVGSAPADSKVGLTVYGTNTGNTEAEKASGCRDVRVLHKPETLDRTALTSAVDGIKASGWTPMGTALRQAAETLPKSGPRSIVLVSDGDDTCSPPEPCEVARELKKQGLDLIVHTIGFAVDAKARAQLTCMAQATGGTYSDAADGPALERTLPRISSAALRNYQAVGIPITGAPTYGAAPVATPGQYLDTIGQKEKRYWAVDVPAGATAYFSGTLSFPRLRDISSTDDLNSLQMRVYGADGEDCNVFEFESSTKSSDGVALTGPRPSTVRPRNARATAALINARAAVATTSN